MPTPFFSNTQRLQKLMKNIKQWEARRENQRDTALKKKNLYSVMKNFSFLALADFYSVGAASEI